MQREQIAVVQVLCAAVARAGENEQILPVEQQTRVMPRIELAPPFRNHADTSEFQSVARTEQFKPPPVSAGFVPRQPGRLKAVELRTRHHPVKFGVRIVVDVKLQLSPRQRQQKQRGAGGGFQRLDRKRAIRAFLPFFDELQILARARRIYL